MKNFEARFARVMQAARPEPSHVVIVERALLDHAKVEDQSALLRDVAMHHATVTDLHPTSLVIALPAKCATVEAWSVMVQRELPQYEALQRAGALDGEERTLPRLRPPEPRPISDHEAEDIRRNFDPEDET